jgi:hypothetical protein
MHILLNRYPNAEIVSEAGGSSTYTYRFSTNGTVVPAKIIVDRKAATARFENLKP